MPKRVNVKSPVPRIGAAGIREGGAGQPVSLPRRAGRMPAEPAGGKPAPLFTALRWLRRRTRSRTVIWPSPSRSPSCVGTNWPWRVETTPSKLNRKTKSVRSAKDRTLDLRAWFMGFLLAWLIGTGMRRKVKARRDRCVPKLWVVSPSPPSEGGVGRGELGRQPCEASPHPGPTAIELGVRR